MHIITILNICTILVCMCVLYIYYLFVLLLKLLIINETAFTYGYILSSPVINLYTTITMNL